jgi:hypothetical protein
VRHCAGHASAAPRARDGACFGERQSAWGERTLVAVTETPYAPEARCVVVAVAVAVTVTVEQAGRSEGFGRAGSKPLGGGSWSRRRYSFALVANAQATVAAARGIAEAFANGRPAAEGAVLAGAWTG